MQRALVLGGGGPVGFAWECGLIAGFAQGGVDLAAADFILGTSAGAIAGARLASGVPAARLAEAVLDPATTRILPPLAGSPEAFARVMGLMREGMGGTRNPAEVRREAGALALAAETAGEDALLAAIAGDLGALPGEGWPGHDFACTAVDAQDGGFQLWDARSGVELARAVASSCSVPGLFAPVTLQGRRYMDGGARSATNADLAGGYEVVVVVSLTPPGADRMGVLLDEEVESLKAGGSTVVIVSPDEASGAALGQNLLDPERKPAAAQAGVTQGLAQAAVLKEIWG